MPLDQSPNTRFDHSSRAGGRRPYGLVLGIVRGFEANEDGAVKILLRHTPQHVWLAPAVWSRENALWLSGANPSEWRDEAPLLVLAHVLRQDGLSFPWLTASEIAVYKLSDRTSYLPVGNAAAARLCAFLVAEQREFRVPLPIEMPNALVRPTAILEDRNERTYLVVTDTATAQSAEDLSMRRAMYAEEHQEVWWWDLRESAAPPPLPASMRRARTAAN